jgi:dihydroflavonol-4-reductase
MSAVMALVEKIVQVPESYTAEGLRVIAGVTYIGDNSKAKRDLGYDPRPLREGLRPTIEHEMRLLAQEMQNTK